MTNSRWTRRVMLYGGALLVVALAFILRETPLYTRVFGTQADRQYLEREEERLARKAAADVRILIIGNSHVVAGDPIPKLEAMFAQDGRNETLYWELSSGAQHPDGHLKSERTMRKVNDGGWDAVIVQGVMYSTSGQYEYPLDAEIELCRKIRAVGDPPPRLILFPEWKQRGNDGEERRAQEACEKVLAQVGHGEIAPVGYAWERVLDEHPGIDLHDGDGNHSTALGAYLTACTLYAAITNRDPRDLPALRNLTLSEDRRRVLQTAAWEAVQAERARAEAAKRDAAVESDG